MRDCPNIEALAKRIGVHYTRLYRWRKNPVHPDSQANPKPSSGSTEKSPRELTLAEELQRMKQEYAQKCLELDFLKGALQKVEARRRQKNENSGDTTSTEKSDR